MKKRKRFLGMRGILAGLCVLSLLGGCGSSASDSMKVAQGNQGNYVSGGSYGYKGETATSAESYDMADYGYDELWSEGDSYQTASNGGSTGNNQNLSKTSASKRKLIKTVNMNLETQEYETLMTNLQERVKELDGYIQNMESNNGSAYSYSRSRKNANLTIRIPQQRLDEFIGSISDLANVVSRSESVDDVTLQYVDMQSHKESLQVEQARLLELLERAESLDDIITLENRLTSVRYQIESMESSLRTFDDQVDYSTVYLRIDEVQVYTVVEEEEESVWERMANGFMDSLTDVKDGFVNFGVWFVVNIPYLIIWAIVLTIAFLIFRKIRRNKKDKSSKTGGKKGKGKSETDEKENADHGVKEMKEAVVSDSAITERSIKD